MALSKRGKVWYMSISHNGKQIRRSTETTNKGLAEKIHAKILTEITEGKWFDVYLGESKTFLELALKYEKEVFSELKSKESVYSYLNQLKDYFGKYKVSKINIAIIDEFKQMRKAKGVKPATINRQLNILKRIFNLAKKRWLWIKEVPYIEMEPKADVKRVRFLSFEEFRKLYDATPNWLQDIITFAAWTGLRQGNILNLKRSQVDFKEWVVFLEADETKNNETLILPLSSKAKEVLEKYLKVYRLESPYIFSQKNGNPYHQRHIQRAFKKACSEAGINDFRFHDLRHCFASWNRQAGVDIDTLADLLGHKDTRMTRRYAHVTQASLRAALGKLDKCYLENSTNLAQFNKKGLSN